MSGMDRYNGRSLDDFDHLKQSIEDILSTPVGSRVMRREYGSRLFALLDAPMNREQVIDVYAAVAEALARWENRLQVEQIDITGSQVGQLELRITGKYILDGKTIVVDGIVVKK